MLEYIFVQKAGWHIQPRNDGTSQVIKDRARQVLDGTFPPATDPATQALYLFDLIRRSSGSHDTLRQQTDRQYQLHFVETSGELYQDEVDWVREHPEEIPHSMSVLLSCKRIICFIDPVPFINAYDVASRERASEIYTSAIVRLIDRLKKNDPTRTPGIESYRVAFCITKCDLPEIWELRSDVDALAKQLFSSTPLYSIASKNLVNSQWFAISSIGPGSGNDYVERLAHPQPYGILEMFEWLLSD